MSKKEISIADLLMILASGLGGGMRVEVIPEDQDMEEYIAKMRAEHAKECPGCAADLAEELKQRQEEELKATRKAGMSKAFEAPYGGDTAADEPPEGQSRFGYMAFIKRGENSYMPISSSLRGTREEVAGEAEKYLGSIDGLVGAYARDNLFIMPVFTTILPT